MDFSFRRWSDSELRKRCFREKTEGCFDSRFNLRGDREKLIEELDSHYYPYKGIQGLSWSLLRSLANYLSVDRLCELASYYSKFSEELGQPNGKLWRDRVLIERGLPAVEIPAGSRHEYLALTDNWWGVFTIILGGKSLLKTSIRCRYAEFEDRSTPREYKYKAFVCTTRGFEIFEVEYRKTRKDSPLEKLRESLENPENWRLVGGFGEIRSLVRTPTKYRSAVHKDAHGEIILLGLNNRGEIWKYKEKIEKWTRGAYEKLPPLQYIHKGPQSLYFITEGKKTGIIEYIVARDPELKLEPRKISVGATPLGSWGRYGYYALGPKVNILTEFNNFEFIVIRSLPGTKGALPNKVYLLPSDDMILIDEANYSLPLRGVPVHKSAHKPYIFANVRFFRYEYHQKLDYRRNPVGEPIAYGISW